MDFSKLYAVYDEDIRNINRAREILSFHKQIWDKSGNEALKCLAELANWVEEMEGDVAISKVVGGSVAVVGGLTALLGMVAAPFTFGGSAILVGGGLAALTGGGLTAEGANLTGSLLSHARTTVVTEKVDAFLKTTEILEGHLEKLVSLLHELIEKEDFQVFSNNQGFSDQSGNLGTLILSLLENAERLYSSAKFGSKAFIKTMVGVKPNAKALLGKAVSRKAGCIFAVVGSAIDIVEGSLTLANKSDAARELRKRRDDLKKGKEELEESVGNYIKLATVAGPVILVKKVRKMYGIDCNKLNIAICGATGVGKSTFINYLFQLKDKDVAAPTGVIETTQSAMKYTSTKFSNLVLWDMPGANTTNHPLKTYFMDKALYAFDLILLVTSGRWQEVDCQVIQQAKKWNKEVIVVRTKADQDVNNIARTESCNKLEAIKHLREKVAKNKPDAQVFIITSMSLLPGKDKYMDEQSLISYMAGRSQNCDPRES